MDSLRSVAVAGISELILLGSMAPMVDGITETEKNTRRTHTRGHICVISDARYDYPVILNWLDADDASQRNPRNS